MNNERDDAAPIDALIEQAHRNLGVGHNLVELAIEVLRLAREGWQPPAAPDRAEVLWEEAHSAFYYKAEEGYAHACDVPREDRMALVREVINRHFDELRAEWEAERPVVVVPADIKEIADWCNVAFLSTRNWNKIRGFVQALDGAKWPAVVPSEDQIKHMTNRFLGWRLPEDFRPDDGISFEPEFNKEWNASQGKPPQRRTPTGTNLFSYTQAEAMVRYILDGAKGDE